MIVTLGVRVLQVWAHIVALLFLYLIDFSLDHLFCCSPRSRCSLGSTIWSWPRTISILLWSILRCGFNNLRIDRNRSMFLREASRHSNASTRWPHYFLPTCGWNCKLPENIYPPSHPLTIFTGVCSYSKGWKLRWYRVSSRSCEDFHNQRWQAVWQSRRVGLPLCQVKAWWYWGSLQDGSGRYRVSLVRFCMCGCLRCSVFYDAQEGKLVYCLRWTWWSGIGSGRVGCGFTYGRTSGYGTTWRL